MIKTHIHFVLDFGESNTLGSTVVRLDITQEREEKEDTVSTKNMHRVLFRAHTRIAWGVVPLYREWLSDILQNLVKTLIFLHNL